HRMVDDIARNDLAAATDAMALRDAMLAQEGTSRRFLILGLPELRELHERQADTFRRTLAALRRHTKGTGLDGLEAGYDAYTALSTRMFAGKRTDEAALKRAAERVETEVEKVRMQQQRALERKLNLAGEREAHTATWALGLALCGVTLAFAVAALLVYSFSSSIGKLQKATHRIAAGDFDHDPRIPPGDEIGSLAQDFTSMALRLKELEQISLDASPLTRLPGNIAIERSINRRLKEGASFAMCYLDLDNFKSYNDRYGYIKASELIREAGQVIHDAVKRLNDPDAFVGHIGGDDFVVIISAGLVTAACESIISDIDAMVPAFYSEQDRAAGAIEGIDRYGVPRVFPLVTISIAALVCEAGDYVTAAEIATAAAEVKDRVKESMGSNYIIVREAGICEA
ncbi:MAG TPA: diguanylate cyclase, partial [Desulfuromonadaceae bacterium]